MVAERPCLVLVVVLLTVFTAGEVGAVIGAYSTTIYQAYQRGDYQEAIEQGGGGRCARLTA